jgi:hypothetical protein
MSNINSILCIYQHTVAVKMEEDLHEMKKRNNQMDVSVMVAYLSKACMKKKPYSLLLVQLDHYRHMQRVPPEIVMGFLSCIEQYVTPPPPPSNPKKG